MSLYILLRGRAGFVATLLSIYFYIANGFIQMFLHV